MELGKVRLEVEIGEDTLSINGKDFLGALYNMDKALVDANATYGEGMTLMAYRLALACATQAEQGNDRAYEDALHMLGAFYERMRAHAEHGVHGNA